AEDTIRPAAGNVDPTSPPRFGPRALLQQHRHSTVGKDLRSGLTRLGDEPLPLFAGVDHDEGAVSDSGLEQVAQGVVDRRLVSGAPGALIRPTIGPSMPG